MEWIIAAAAVIAVLLARRLARRATGAPEAEPLNVINITGRRAGFGPPARRGRRGVR